MTTMLNMTTKSAKSFKTARRLVVSNAKHKPLQLENIKFQNTINYYDMFSPVLMKRVTPTSKSREDVPPKIPYKKSQKMFDSETIKQFNLSPKESVWTHRYNHIAQNKRIATNRALVGRFRRTTNNFQTI